MRVSIVIPAYNEAHRLPRSMAKLVPFLRTFDGAEVIVVDDGSTDGTAALAERYLRELPNGRLLRLPWNSGKGAAVRAGVSLARGGAIVFMDADMASDLDDLPALVEALAEAEVVLGSRRAGTEVTRSGGRKAGAWAFNQIIRALTRLNLDDTQCGFKAFRHAEAKLLFSLSRSNGFGFDVEILALARALDYRVAEVPVRWSEVAGGRFRLARHTPAMIYDAFRAGRLARRRSAAWPYATEAGGAAAPAPTMAPAETVEPGTPSLLLLDQRTAEPPAAGGPFGWESRRDHGRPSEHKPDIPVTRREVV